MLILLKISIIWKVKSRLNSVIDDHVWRQCCLYCSNQRRRDINQGEISIRGSIPILLHSRQMRVVLFFPSTRFLSHWVFPSKVLTRQYKLIHHHINDSEESFTLFPFALVLSHWVFQARFLMRKQCHCMVDIQGGVL